MTAEGRLAFVFPGQGSQRVGMGSALVDSDPDLIDSYVRRAGDATGLPLREHMLEGPIETLTRTDVAQPALLCVSLALAEVAGELGLRPDFVAGHSLGEYTAAVAAGSLTPDDGIRAVCRRGQLMAAIQDEAPGTMAAVMGLSPETVNGICRKASEAGTVSMANVNSPTQIVVSGERAAVERAMALAEEAGAGRVIALQVGAAFHSELMRPAQERMRETLGELAWQDAAMPLAANASGQLVRGGAEVREALIDQIASPVQWVACVRTLVGAGCRVFVELGPGRVLSGLIRQIDPEVQTAAADSREKLVAFVAEHPQLVA